MANIEKAMKQDMAEFNKKRAEGSSSELSGLLCAEDRAELERVLTACKTKLQVYRAHTDGEYKGGMEHRALIKLIEDTHARFCA